MRSPYCAWLVLLAWPESVLRCVSRKPGPLKCKSSPDRQRPSGDVGLELLSSSGLLHVANTLLRDRSTECTVEAIPTAVQEFSGCLDAISDDGDSPCTCAEDLYHQLSTTHCIDLFMAGLRDLNRILGECEVFGALVGESSVAGRPLQLSVLTNNNPSCSFWTPKEVAFRQDWTNKLSHMTAQETARLPLEYMFSRWISMMFDAQTVRDCAR